MRNADSCRRRDVGRRGQSMVEFALAIVVVLVFLFGIIDWSIAYFQYKQVISNAGRAARYASIYGVDPANGGTAIKNYVMCGATTCPDGSTVIGLTSGNIAVARVPYDETGIFTDPSITIPRWYVVIQISNWGYNMFTPFLGRFLNAGTIRIVHPMECPLADCSAVS